MKGLLRKAMERGPLNPKPCAPCSCAAPGPSAAAARKYARDGNGSRDKKHLMTVGVVT